VLLSLLVNPLNQDNWPTPLPQDIHGSSYGLRNCIQQTLSEMRGQTLLPLPHGIDSIHEVEQQMRET
jgi:dynein heavy chain, axonemal